MRVYYDPVTNKVSHTFSGPEEYAPQGGTYIELPEQDLGELNGLEVQTGAVVRTTIAPVQARAIARINELAGAKRATFGTDIAFQGDVYQLKYDEAVAYLAENPEPVTPAAYAFIAGETGVTAPTAYEVAQLWLNMQNVWVTVVLPGIETARLGAIYAVEAATTEAQIQAIEAAYTAALQ